MTCEGKKMISTIVTVSVFLAIACLCELVNSHVLLNGEAGLFASSVLFATRSLILITLLLAWCLSVNRRVINTRARCFSLGLGFIMLVALSISLCSNGFAFSFIAKLSVLAELLSCLLAVIASFLFVLTLTNANYCRSIKSKSLRFIPCIVYCSAFVLWGLRFFLVINSDLVFVNVLACVLIFECAICSGIVATTAVYEKMISSTNLALQIVDTDYNLRFESPNASPLSEEQMKAAQNKSLRIGNALLSSAQLNGGYILWQSDITKLNTLAMRLKDTQEQISEDNVLLYAELDLKKNRAQADEKSRLYDRITREVSKQLASMDELLSLIEKQPENTDAFLAGICILGAYIKRRGNLLLLSEDNRLIHSRELEYCIRESLDNLSLAKIYTSFSSQCEGKIPALQLIAIYDMYEDLIERLLETVNAVMLNLVYKNGSLKFNLQIGCEKEINNELLKDFVFPYGNLRYIVDGQDLSVNLSLENGGDCDD